MQCDSQPHDLVENTVRNFPLRGARQLDKTSAPQRQRYLILIRFKDAALLSHEVADYHVASLGFEFPARFRLQVLGFGGEADQQPVALFAPQFGEDVGRGIEFERDSGGRLLDLLLGNFGQMEIGDGGGFHDDGGRLQVREDRVSRISMAVRTGTTLTPAGGARLTGPDTRITSAPRAAAACASA